MLFRSNFCIISRSIPKPRNHKIQRFNEKLYGFLFWVRHHGKLLVCGDGVPNADSLAIKERTHIILRVYPRIRHARKDFEQVLRRWPVHPVRFFNQVHQITPNPHHPFREQIKYSQSKTDKKGKTNPKTKDSGFYQEKPDWFMPMK